MHQPVDHRSGRTEQLELNMVVACPAIKKHQHSQAPAADCFHCRKIERDDAGISLFLHNIAKLENRFAADDPAFTFYYCEVGQVLNAYGQHGSPPLLIARARAGPKVVTLFFSPIRNYAVATPRTFGRLSWNVFLQRTLYLRRFAVGHHAKRDYLGKGPPRAGRRRASTASRPQSKFGKEKSGDIGRFSVWAGPSRAGLSPAFTACRKVTPSLGSVAHPLTLMIRRDIVLSVLYK